MKLKTLLNMVSAIAFSVLMFAAVQEHNWKSVALLAASLAIFEYSRRRRT